MAVTKKSRTIGVIAGSVAVAAAMILLKDGGEEAPHWHPWDGTTVQRDLVDIRTDSLRVLVLRDPLVWEERQRATTGLEYELLQRFARKAKLKLVIVPFDHPDSLLAALWRGRGDIGAMQAVAYDEWKHHFAITVPYASVVPLIARPRPDVPASDTIETLRAASDSLARSKASPFAEPSFTFKRAHAPIVAAPSGGTEDDLLVSVVLGERNAAIISDLRAGHEAERFPLLEYSEAIGPSQELRFVTRASSPELLKTLDRWLLEPKEVEARKHLLRSYAEEVPRPGPLRSLRAKGMRGDSISPFDVHFREHAAVAGWDWQLLAAMAWKETRFDSTVTSSKGAMGIMQFMPQTAARMGLDTTSNMEDHIQAAARYLSRLDTMWLRAVPEKEQRLRFVLASYNAGPGHIIDAQRLAEQLGLDPKRWDGNVERAVLLLAKPRYFLRPEMKNGYCKGSQVFQYVRGVLTVYRQLKARGR